MSGRDGAVGGTGDAGRADVEAFLRHLSQDLKTLATMLQGGDTVLSDGRRLPTRLVAADIATRTAAAVDHHVAAAAGTTAKPGSAPVWQDIASAADIKEALVAGRYASGRWYVTKGVRDREGGWSGLNAAPPSHWMLLPKPPG